MGIHFISYVKHVARTTNPWESSSVAALARYTCDSAACDVANARSSVAVTTLAVGGRCGKRSPTAQSRASLLRRRFPGLEASCDAARLWAASTPTIGRYSRCSNLRHRERYSRSVPGRNGRSNSTTRTGSGSRASRSTQRVTRSNRAPATWLGDDPLVHLRQWATEFVYAMPDVNRAVVGTERSADMRLLDPTRSVSGRHGRLVRRAKVWWLKDLRSNNGISIEGSRPQKEFLITPGVEIGLGDLILVAENQTLVRLRAFLGRILGRGAENLRTIDLAMRAIRNAAYRRSQLVIAGVEDVVSIARQIHVHTTPPGAPFIVCGKRLHDSDTWVRVTSTRTDASAALEAAAGGTVCVRHDKPPAGYSQLMDATVEPLSTAQMYICAKKASQARALSKAPIVVPKLSSRAADKKNIVKEYALDVIREFGADESCFSEYERDWIADNTDTFTDIEIATLRTVARNALGSIHEAANRLVLPSALLRHWFMRRKPLSR